MERVSFGSTLRYALTVCALYWSAHPISAQQPSAPEPEALSRTDYRQLADLARPTAQEMSTYRTIMSREVNPGKLNPEDGPIVDKVMNFRMSEFTLLDPASMKVLPRKRVELKRDLVSAGRVANPELHDRLNKLLLEGLGAIATSPEYHPVSRYNSMVMIGMLDKREKGEQPQPLPLVEAFTFMLEAVKDGKHPDYIRIAALEGIQRHAEIELPATQRTALVTVLNGLLTNRAPSPGGDAAGSAWLRMQSIKVLNVMIDRNMNEAGNPETVRAVTDLLVDDAASLNARADACVFVGNMPRATLQSSGKLPELIQGCLRYAITMLERCGDESLTRVSASDVLYYLSCVRWGLTNEATGKGGLFPLVPNNDRTNVQAALDKLSALTNNLKVPANTLTTPLATAKRSQLQSTAIELKGLLDKLAPPIQAAAAPKPVSTPGN